MFQLVYQLSGIQIRLNFYLKCQYGWNDRLNVSKHAANGNIDAICELIFISSHLDFRVTHSVLVCLLNLFLFLLFKERKESGGG